MTTACWEHSLANVSWHAGPVITHLHMQWPTFACQIAHCPAWLTVGTSPCGVALGGSRGHARAEERAGGKAAFLAAKGPSCQAGLCQPVAPALDTSLELICLAVGSVCKLHRPFAAPLCPLAWPSKGSQAEADWQAVLSDAQPGARSWNLHTKACASMGKRSGDEPCRVPYRYSQKLHRIHKKA